MMAAQAQWQAGMLEANIRQTEYLAMMAEQVQAVVVALAEIRALLVVVHPPEPGQLEGESESVAELLAGLGEDVAEIGGNAGMMDAETEAG